MKIYIVEDDITVIRILQNIVEDNDLGKICGSSKNGHTDISEILMANPDIILIDLLMPEKDGIEIVKELKEKGCKSKFIMISQVSSKNMISKAYSMGIDFFINKPINVIEVKSIIDKVSKYIENENVISNIKKMFLNNTDESESSSIVNRNKKIQYILNKLGMSGEKGAKEILSICEYLYSNNQDMSEVNIKEICNVIGLNSNVTEQRIRRAITKGMSNIANLGIEDYMNESFVMYSNTLFNFEDVKAEMDYIRGKKSYGGKISIKKFIDGIMILTEE